MTTIANGFSTISAINTILKQIVEPKLQTMLEAKTALWKKLPKKSQEFGQSFRIPYEKAWNRGIGASAEDGVLPPIDAMTTDEFTLAPTYLWFGLGLTKQSIDRTKGKNQAIVSQLTQQMDNVRLGMAKEMNRLLWGYEGRVGISAGTGTGTTACTMKAPDYDRYMKVGDKLAFHNGTGAIRSGETHTITAINRATHIVTFDGNVASSDGDYIYRALTGTDATSKGNYPNGLRHIVDDLTYSVAAFQGKTRTVTGSADILNGGVFDNSTVNRAITTSLLNLAYDFPTENSPYDSCDLIVGHTSVMRALRDLITPDVRFAPGGKGELRIEPKFDGKEFMTDVDAPYNELFMLNTETIAVYEAHPFEFWDDGGGIMQREDYGTSPKANLRARGEWAGNIGSKCPSANVRITDITT
jgi:hypothetical protein